jgi:uncharacterized membrane protein
MAETQGPDGRLTDTGAAGPTSSGDPVVPEGATEPSGAGVPSAVTPGGGAPTGVTPGVGKPGAGTQSVTAESGPILEQHDGGPSVPPTPEAVVDLVHRIEASEGLDRPAEVVEKVANAVAPAGPVHDALTGTWLGHALHPLMTDFPLGMWLSASLLDFVGGKASRTASRRLVGLGVLAAVPTAATGLAEWLHVDRASRRVGVVHANSNSLGLVLYTASYLARRRGHHFRGVALAVGGGMAASFGGYLGGHLSIARKAGTLDERFAEPANGAEPATGGEPGLGS